MSCFVVVVAHFDNKIELIQVRGGPEGSVESQIDRHVSLFVKRILIWKMQTDASGVLNFKGKKKERRELFSIKKWKMWRIELLVPLSGPFLLQVINQNSRLDPPTHCNAVFYKIEYS